MGRDKKRHTKDLLSARWVERYKSLSSIFDSFLCAFLSPEWRHVEIRCIETLAACNGVIRAERRLVQLFSHRLTCIRLKCLSPHF